MACLLITESPVDQGGKHFRLANRTVAAGRDPAREIQILDAKVSRKHFLVRSDGERRLLILTMEPSPIRPQDPQDNA